MTLLSVSGLQRFTMHFLPYHNIPLEGSLSLSSVSRTERRDHMQKYRTADRVFDFGLLRRHVLDCPHDEPAAVNRLIGHG